jgi:hypothetical protein
MTTLREWVTAAGTSPVLVTRDGVRDAMQHLWEQCEARKAETDVFSLDEAGNPRSTGQLFRIDAETHRYWKANAGNAKARRRWRRRDFPNTQRAQALARGEAEYARWEESVYGAGPVDDDGGTQ